MNDHHLCHPDTYAISWPVILFSFLCPNFYVWLITNFSWLYLFSLSCIFSYFLSLTFIALVRHVLSMPGIAEKWKIRHGFIDRTHSWSSLNVEWKNKLHHTESGMIRVKVNSQCYYYRKPSLFSIISTWISHQDLKFIVVIYERYYHPSCSPNRKLCHSIKPPLILVSCAIKYQMIHLLHISQMLLFLLLYYHHYDKQSYHYY